MSIPLPSSRRTLGPMLTFARSLSGAEKQSNSKMDPSVRWDDGRNLLMKSRTP